MEPMFIVTAASHAGPRWNTRVIYVYSDGSMTAEGKRA
ncbi:hypothetical protein V6Z11_D06G243700 [Gossypium hirsutum]